MNSPFSPTVPTRDIYRQSERERTLKCLFDARMCGKASSYLTTIHITIRDRVYSASPIFTLELGPFSE